MLDKINNFHNEQVEKMREHQESLKEMEKRMLVAINDANDERAKYEVKINKMKGLEDDMERDRAKLKAELISAKKTTEIINSKEANIVEKQEQLDELIEHNHEDSERLMKQKESLDKINTDLIKKGRWLEMEERRIKALEIQVNQKIKDNKIQEFING